MQVIQLLFYDSGPIDLFAIDIAFVSGASQICTIDINEYRLGISQKMGDNVIFLNPLNDDVVKIIKDKKD